MQAVPITPEEPMRLDRPIKVTAAAVQATSLAQGASGTVVRLDGALNGDMRKLLSLGIVPGQSIRIVRHKPVLVVALGYSQVALDRALARSIWVSR